MSGSMWVMGGTSDFGLTLSLALQPLSSSYSPDCITSPCSKTPALQIYIIWQIHLSTYPGEDPSGLVKTVWGRAWSQRCSVVSFSQMVQTASYGNSTALACTQLNQAASSLIVYRPLKIITPLFYYGMVMPLQKWMCSYGLFFMAVWVHGVF
jgi:hypothetical protein